MKNFLPLGSIVTLKDSSKKMMIYGRTQVAQGTGKIYDYLACLYPQGFFKPDMLLCFNEEQIDQVLFTGYADEEEEAFVQRLNELLEARKAAQQTGEKTEEA